MIRKAVVFIVGICVAFALVLSLGDLIGYDAWARFDALGLSAIPVGIGLILFSAVGGIAYLLDKKKEDE
ncbi:hypothetical protein [Lentibacter sp. XHP0401]|jgi:hypothetical protein|uniref:hypothetical protein n=1 Tax=Lentibacter sp. XHP0401 TaxID=2984334 RepID=UPI0021E97E7B|nr:hypothetical protein [Lentibacter sp. XHP0401]MCV2893627.1 hypothetical protein [Lentibacter sp. XHP0401]